MDILRITTAGSVDDGKSTLIGRLLYDTRSITNDKLEAIESASRRKGLDFTDLSLLTDGLIAEREQGITIDVAHIYFSTANRKYIIADSPGHTEYTRNMITGASRASVFLILIDARKGVIEQTKRHFYIACLLRIRHVIVCINKMDLAGFDEVLFEKIKNDFSSLADRTGFPEQEIHFIPVVAKDGDNIVFPSVKMSWYQRETLLELLENISISNNSLSLPSRFPVQYVVRPHSDEFHDFRGYAGMVSSGSFRPGDRITVLPGLRSSAIKDIHRYKESVPLATASDSVVITLEDEIDISRGNMIVKSSEVSYTKTEINATICWMDETPCIPGKMFLLQHGTNRVKAKLVSIGSIFDISLLQPAEGKKSFALNDIGDITLKLASPLFADLYNENPANGSFILIDEFTNNTVAIGFVR
jgi:sulfate adenylyltransferase subunit 1